MSDVADMAVYDRLPRIVREALRITVHEWKANDAWTALMQGMGADDLAQYILNMDRSLARKENPYGLA